MKENVIILDFETASLCELKECGVANYAAHESTRVLSLCFKFVNIPAIYRYYPGMNKEIVSEKKILSILKNHKGLFVSHNWFFDYLILRDVLKIKTDINKWSCTMATAYRNGLPGKLDALSVVMNLTNKKMTVDGKRLVDKYSKPWKGKLREITPDDLQLLLKYNTYDVLACEEIFKTLPRLDQDKYEWPIFKLDQKMNLSGLRIDLKNLDKTIKFYENQCALAEKEAEKFCGKEESGTLTINSPKGFKIWMHKRGFEIDNCQAGTLEIVESKLEENKKHKDILRALKLKKILSAAAPKKLYAMKNFAGRDGKVRGFLQYHGTHTGRFSGRGIQPQNLPRKKSEKEFLSVIKDLQTIKGLDLNSHKMIQGILRSFIIPDTGKSLSIGDFSAIEARILFWLSDCKAGLKSYRSGEDIYKSFAARGYGKPLERINKEERFLGKTSILGLGYGMGVDKFIETCAKNKLLIPYQLGERLVKLYRELYHEVPKLWYAVENAFINAINGKSGKIRCLSFDRNKNFVWIELPGGKKLYYYRPFIENRQIKLRNPRGGINPAWGGLLVENIVQSISRNLLCEAILQCEKNDLNVKLTVHDEIIVEIEKKNSGLKKIMCTLPAWADGLPIDAEVVEGLKRYKKI